MERGSVAEGTGTFTSRPPSLPSSAVLECYRATAIVGANYAGGYGRQRAICCLIFSYVADLPPSAFGAGIFNADYR